MVGTPSACVRPTPLVRATRHAPREACKPVCAPALLPLLLPLAGLDVKDNARNSPAHWPLQSRTPDLRFSSGQARWHQRDAPTEPTWLVHVPSVCQTGAMDLTSYVNNLGREFATLAEAGGEEARALVERLTGSLESAIRMTLLDALSAAADEISRDLAPGSDR